LEVGTGGKKPDRSGEGRGLGERKLQGRTSRWGSTPLVVWGKEVSGKDELTYGGRGDSPFSLRGPLEKRGEEVLAGLVKKKGAKGWKGWGGVTWNNG